MSLLISPKASTKMNLSILTVIVFLIQIYFSLDSKAQSFSNDDLLNQFIKAENLENTIVFDSKNI